MTKKFPYRPSGDGEAYPAFTGVKKEAARFAALCVSAMMLAFTIKSFVWSGNLSTGGATGLVLLLQEAARRFANIELPYTGVNLLVNAVPIYIGFRFIGKKFTITSCVGIVMTSLLTDLIPSIMITGDPLLCAVFGGILDGAAVSMCLSAGTTTGGTDFISIYLSEKKGVDSWNIILAYNVVILLLAGLLNGWETTMYSIIFQFIMTQILQTLYKRYQKHTLLIVTEKPQEVCRIIAGLTRHSATILRGEGSYEHGPKTVVYSVVSRAESKSIIHAIRQREPGCFINLLRTEAVSGEFYMPPND